MSNMNDEKLTFTELINILFEEVRHPAGHTYSAAEVARATGISPPQLSRLRSGEVTNPQLETLTKLCHFFNVPLNYFEARTLQQANNLLMRSHDPEGLSPRLQQMLFRAKQLSEEGQDQVLEVLRWIQNDELARAAGQQLPDVPRLLDDEDDDFSSYS